MKFSGEIFFENLLARRFSSSPRNLETKARFLESSVQRFLGEFENPFAKGFSRYSAKL